MSYWGFMGEAIYLECFMYFSDGQACSMELVTEGAVAIELGKSGVFQDVLVGASSTDLYFGEAY